jgi:hypothetical protein
VIASLIRLLAIENKARGMQKLSIALAAEGKRLTAG